MSKLLFPAVALSMALSTFGAAVQAQEATPDHWMQDFKAQLSRAEVRAEVMRAPTADEFDALVAEAMGFIPHLRAGTVTITLYDDEGNVLHHVTHAQAPTRASVVAELERSKASGEFARLNAEAWDFLSPSGTGRAAMVVARR